MEKRGKIIYALITVFLLLGVFVIVDEKITRYKIKALNNDMSTRYIDNNDGTITDTVTDLMWKKCSEGDLSNKCVGEHVKISSEEALEKFSNHTSFAGYNNWRLPNSKEISTLIYCSNGKSQIEAYHESCGRKKDGQGNYKTPTIYSNVFPNTLRYYYWIKNNDEIYSGVHFNYGKGNWGILFPIGAHIRLVREIK